jgi:hypothetical protein
MRIKLKDGSFLSVPVQSETFLVEQVNYPSSQPFTTRTKLPLNGALRGLQLLLSGSITIDASLDGVLAPEGCAALISEIRIMGDPKGGTKQVGLLKKIDFAAAYQYNTIMESLAGLKLEPTPITKSSANSPFRIAVNVDFRMPWCDEERKTLLLADSIQNLTLEIDWRPLTDMVTTGVVTVGSTPITLQISVDQFVDRFSIGQAYAQNLQISREKPVVAAQSDFTFDLDGKEKLRGILIKTFTRSGVTYHTPVDTVINSLTFLAKDRPLKYYPSIHALKAKDQRVYGIAMPTGYSFLDFMSEGNFDSALPKEFMGRVQLRLDVANISNAVVKIYPVEIR